MTSKDTKAIEVARLAAFTAEVTAATTAIATAGTRDLPAAIRRLARAQEAKRQAQLAVDSLS